jgi:hypothetical protein
MLKLYIDESYLFTEAIADIKKYYPNIPDDTFMQLISLDPTYRGNDSAGKYGKWLLNLYNKGNLSEDEFDEVPKLLNQFTLYRNRVQNKDLNSYKTLDALADILASVVDDDSMLTDRQRLRFLKNAKSGKIKTGKEDDYDIVLDTPKFVVYVPHTHEASMKLGKGTKWCTAHENPQWYNHYTKDGGKLYIVKNKKTGERWQYSDETYDFLDDNDEEFNAIALLAKDKQLSNFFSQFGFEGMEHFNEEGYYIYTGVAIPDNMKSQIDKILIADDVKYISEKAFEDCDYLTDVIISDSVKIIGSRAFRSCNCLRSITIPSSVRNIESGAFGFCEFLKTVNLSEGLQNISADAFENCERLSSIVIPSTVKHIGHFAFGECVSLSSVLISDGVQEIDDEAFAGCISLESIIIPDSVTVLGKDVFESCDELKSIVLSNNIDTIKEDTFEYCSELLSIEIPNSVTVIDKYAFNNCISLKSIKIPDSVTTINDRAFYDCESLKSIILPNSIVNIGNNVFSGCEDAIVYTNNDYVIQYCNENGYTFASLNENSPTAHHGTNN